MFSSCDSDRHIFESGFSDYNYGLIFIMIIKSGTEKDVNLQKYYRVQSNEFCEK